MQTLVSPSSYNYKLKPKNYPVTFQHEKTNRLNTINDFGPSPAFYDTTTGMSMCSSQGNLHSKRSLHKSPDNERS